MLDEKTNSRLIINTLHIDLRSDQFVWIHFILLFLVFIGPVLKKNKSKEKTYTLLNVSDDSAEISLLLLDSLCH